MKMLRNLIIQTFLQKNSLVFKYFDKLHTNISKLQKYLKDFFNKKVIIFNNFIIRYKNMCKNKNI